MNFIEILEEDKKDGILISLIGKSLKEGLEEVYLKGIQIGFESRTLSKDNSRSLDSFYGDLVKSNFP